jgi:NitT/TauT family transport system ATP-binding protein
METEKIKPPAGGNEPTKDPGKPPKDPRDDFLIVDHVVKAYGDHIVLENVNLKMDQGELTTVVGPSGCGKSTLLRLILGQEQPTLGRVTVDEVDVGPPGPDRGIVFQKYALFPHLTVLENIMLGDQLPLGMIQAWSNRKKIRAEGLQYLEYVRLAEHAYKYPHQLSGGMQQRVAIAQALIKKPKILMMDEPFGALDPGTREAMQVLILDLWKEHDMTIFFVTHDLEEAVYLGTRILVLSQYYQGEDRDGSRTSWGARIVADHPLNRMASSTRVKTTDRFGALIAQIREDGFDPENRKQIKDFNMKHPDSIL